MEIVTDGQAPDPISQLDGSSLRGLLLDGWDLDAIMAKCVQSQKERLFIQETIGCKPNWAFRYRPDDGSRFFRNTGAVETKAKSRYPFVEPTPFER